ncbi:hypothetical protein QVD17_24029 [Tagetes erecta]|uniref:CCHC-type domain-containing protein n=1 Tax=Tagetes erecta TaxID=13708 RepID=A0AAD8NUH6_TARER|nr:hypothetical protein QVD17_24029 [Tagetes erecta]
MLGAPVTALKKKKMKKTKLKSAKVVKGTEIQLENAETKEDVGALKESDATTEIASEKSDNIVLRKLLRGPRYFDPQDNSGGNCYNCGEGGHTAANCTSAKHKKPCFVCGSLEHIVKQCNKGKDCFICKKGGHRAKDCPEKSNRGSQSAKFCLNCGDSGHEMFSCKSNYSADDLKEIQCYVCKCYGHLCCVNYAGEGSREVSCYRCGQLGHSGVECARVHAEASSKWTPSSCYTCGEEAYTACKCTFSSKAQKRKVGSSSSKKKKKRRKKNQLWGNHLGESSMPHDLGNAHKTQPGSSQPKSIDRGGWTTDSPHVYNYNHNYNHNHNHGWGSSMTPATYLPNDGFHAGNGYLYSNGGFQFHGGNGYQSSNDRFQFPGSNGYQSFNDRFQFHGSNGYQPSNDRFQFHGASGYQSANDRFQFHGSGGYRPSNDRFQFHGSSGYANTSSGFHSNQGMFQYESTVGPNGYQHRFGNYRE